MIAKRIIILGKVQGVWFRKHTQDKARSLHLAGEVWNNSDGSVEIEVIGPEQEIQTLIDWCHTGSPESQVSQISVYELERNEWPENFEIRH